MATTNEVIVILIEIWLFNVPPRLSAIGFLSSRYDWMIGLAMASIFSFVNSGVRDGLRAIRFCTSSINDVSAVSMFGWWRSSPRGGRDSIKCLKGSAISMSIFTTVRFLQEAESACRDKKLVTNFPPHGILTMHAWHPVNCSVTPRPSFFDILILKCGFDAVMSHCPSPRFCACSGYGSLKFFYFAEG